MSLLEELKSLGVDVDEGLDRVMGDSSLYEMMLGMFIDSVNGNRIHPADFDGEDLVELTERVHMLKGVTGNLSMIPLFTQYTQVLDLLRAGRPQEAKDVFVQFQPVQKEIMDCIVQAAGSGRGNRGE